ncbi:MAG: hypothetical protein MJZ01_06625 [Bacteroidales bacterium]|nr:hypothetical protein [Bacteroidales bacterium]
MKLIGYISQGVMIVLMVLSVVLMALSATEASSDAVAAADGSWTGTVITWAIVVFAIGLIGAAASYVVGAFVDTSNLLKSAIVVVGAVVLVGICWALADGTPLPLVGYEGSENVPFWLKIADTGLFLGYIAAIVAIVSIVVSEVVQLFR